MIPRKIGVLPDRRGFNTDRGIYIMALNKTVGDTKVKAGLATKKMAPVKKAAAKTAAPAKPAASKKAAIKKPATVKLTVPQHEMLKKLHGYTDPAGYHTEKKPELKVLATLLKHRLIKTGKKDSVTKQFYHFISTIGTKHLASGVAPKS
jgi:hypothetical protein